MLSVNHLVNRTLYDVLGLKEDASHEEIRTSYRSAILNCHPDKLQKTAESSNSDDKAGDRFMEIQRAWDILGNSKSRAVYNNELQSLKQDAVVAEDINLGELTVEDGGDVVELVYPCRCGDCFSIDSLGLGEMGYHLLSDGNKVSLQKLDALPASVILPCGSCSLKVRLLIDTDAHSL